MKKFLVVVFLVAVAPVSAFADCDVVFADNGVATVAGCQAGATITAWSLDAGLLIEAGERLCMKKEGEKNVTIGKGDDAAGAFNKTKAYALKCEYVGRDKEKRPEGVLITGTRVYTFSPLR